MGPQCDCVCVGANHGIASGLPDQLLLFGVKGERKKASSKKSIRAAPVRSKRLEDETASQGVDEAGRLHADYDEPLDEAVEGGIRRNGCGGGEGGGSDEISSDDRIQQHPGEGHEDSRAQGRDDRNQTTEKRMSKEEKRVRISIKEVDSGKLVKVMGEPMSEWKADKLTSALLRKIDTERFYVDEEEVDEKGNVIDADS